MNLTDPLAPLEIVATNAMFCDPALDLDDPAEPAEGVLTGQEMLEEYRKTRDPSVLRFKAGMEPTKFVGKPVPAAFVATVLDAMPSVGARNMYAFLTGCHEIHRPGAPPLRPKKFTKISYGAQQADEATWMGDVVRLFGMDTVQEIGRVIYERARLPEGARGPFSVGGLGR